jgi:O-antigen ligase
LRLRGAVGRGAVPPFLVAAVPLVWLGAEEGGYFPEAWGGPTLVLLWIAMLALLFEGVRVPGRLSLAILGTAAALTTWIGVSTTWSTLPSQSVLEFERALLYVAAVLAGLLVVRRRAAAVLAGVLFAIAGVCAYALSTRLFPHVFGVAERQPFQSPALFEPIGYSNALGLFAAVGILLALGFAAEGGSRLSRSLGAAAVVLLAVVVYFASSRGAWVALAAGLAAAVALAPARGRLLRRWLIGPLPLSALAVSVASHADALRRVDPPLRDAALQGALLFLALALLAAAAAAAALVAPTLERGPARARSRLAVTGALAAILIAGVTLARDAPLGPTRPAASLGTEAARPPAPPALGTRRGASIALGRRDEYWQAAWNAFSERPLTGFGAGAFEQYWLQHREHARNVRDAHNLYLETLAELGVPGLALLAGLFGIPLAAATVARARPLAPAALGALTAYLAHAVVDWDWEVPVVTVGALLVAVVLVSLADEQSEPVALSFRLRASAILVAVAASVFSVVALAGNRAGAAADEALRAGAAERAEAEARGATRWMPWSSHPLRALGEAQLLQSERAQARQTLRKAIVKDERDWRLWFDLAVAADGPERREALDRAARLNPLSRRIADLRRRLRDA